MSFGWTIRIMGFVMLPLVIFATFAVQLPKVPVTLVEEGSTATNKRKSAASKKKADFSVLKNKIYLLFVVGVLFFNFG
jgi:hypothetical protein